MVIKKTINKEAIKEMPKVLFPGQIHMVQTPWEAEKAVTYLKQYPLLGIDSETRRRSPKDNHTRLRCYRYPLKKIASSSA